eukprot:TRINITY_DN7543_c0_g2_i3.p1 TRINITY_DN7543_c0_g2~~TRINITY_DN7543_c0_g2_i3.p1  ORF type:complete len:120 (-),score=23.23 TRINITY_DN7543_c0_g2_i3:21-380(-)
MISIINGGDAFSLKPGLHFLQCIFASQESSDFLFVNDLHVLIDVIILAVNNLGQGDLLCLDFLKVLSHLWNNLAHFADSGYKKQELVTLVTQLLETYPPSHPIYEAAASMILHLPNFSQ